MKKLTDGNIYKNFILFAIPIALSGILSHSYGVINSAIAGRYLGTNGLAAIGATSGLITFLSSILWGYGVGVSIYAARLFGAGKNKELKNVVWGNFFLNLLISVTVAAIIIIFINPIMGWLKVAPEIVEDAKTYLRIYMIAYCISSSNYFCVFIMNSLGESAFPFWMSFVSGVLTIIGSLLAVVVFDGGVGGLALSTAISVAVVGVCYVIRLRKYFAVLGVASEGIRLEKQFFRNAFTYGGSNMLQQSIMYVVNVAIAPTINVLGADATAGYAIASTIFTLNAQLYQSASKCVSNYTAQAIGLERYDNIKKGVNVGFIQGVVFLSPLLLVCVIFARPVNSLFFADTAGSEAFEFAIIFSRYYLPFLYLNAVNNLFHALFRGIASSGLLNISTAIGAAVRIVLSYILSAPMGIHGIYLAWVLSWAIEVVYSLYIYLSGRWKKYIQKNDG